MRWISQLCSQAGSTFTITGLILMFFLLSTKWAVAQESDSLSRRNGIKIEFASQLLYQNVFMLSYERVVKRNQSFQVTAGMHHFPQVVSLGNGISVTKDNKPTGYKIGGEYRFYLKKENKYRAPRGVYLGPYVAYLNFKNNRLIEVTTGTTPEEATLKSKLSVLNIGAQVGYQFLLGNRWAIDLVFIGPSLSNYSARFDLEGGPFTFDPDEVQQEILDNLIDRFPGLEDLIQNRTLSTDGKVDSWSFGYRYQFHVGYFFGRKKPK